MTQHMSCTSESFTGVYLNFNIKDKLSAKCKAIEKQTCHTNIKLWGGQLQTHYIL